MIVIILLHFLLIISNSNGQSYCTPKNPFRILDGECATFEYACYKKNDQQCEELKIACQNCPPSNITLTTLTNILNINQNQSQSANKMINLAEEIKNLVDSKNPTSTLIWISIIINIILFIIFIICIIIYLVKRKCRIFGFRASYRRMENNHNAEQINLLSMQGVGFQKILNESNIQLIKEMKEINNEKEYSTLESVICYKLKFQIVNQFDETELIVSKFDNVIKLKKSICDRNMNMNDYKSMIMKYKGDTLDNNQYLLSCIDSTNTPIFCEFDNNVEVDAMIVIKLKCDNIYPEMLQISKHQQIKDLKIIISKLNKTNHKDLLIFYNSNELDDDKTIDDYKIEENDWIQVVNKYEKIQNITMKSIFTDKETISIEFSKFETVSSIINKSIQKIQPKMATNHFAIYFNNKVLEEEKFIYEYNIDSKSFVRFCYLKSVDEIEKTDEPVYYDHLKIFRARHKISNRPVLIKAYYIEFMEREHGNINYLMKILKDDLQIFQITKSHPRFIQIIDIYMDDLWVYIGMNIFGVTLKSFLSERYKPQQPEDGIPQYQISKWAYQILEGLKFLHDHNIIMKDMNPIDIWIDGNNIKLPSFNLTNYLNQISDNVNEDKHGVFGYVAPEILESKPYDASVDVWSLGVIMIYIITHGKLFGLNISKTVQKIKETHTIEYDKTHKPEDLINFIDCCVKGDPEERHTIDQLMKMDFIEKYLL